MDCGRDTRSSGPRLPIVRSASASHLPQIAAGRRVDASGAKKSEEAVNAWLRAYQYRRVASYGIGGADTMDIPVVTAITNQYIWFIKGRNVDELRRRLEVASMAFYRHRLLPSSSSLPLPPSSTTPSGSSEPPKRSWSAVDLATNLMPAAWVRATIVAFIGEIERGATLVRIKTLEGLINLINNDVTPVVPLARFPEKDWCPEVMHDVVDVLSGESRHARVWVGGKGADKIEPARRVLLSRRVELIQPDADEVRAIVRSPAYGVGLSALSLSSLSGSLHLAQLLTACLVEVTGAGLSFTDRQSHQTPGSADVAANIAGFLRSSKNVTWDGCLMGSEAAAALWRGAVTGVPAKLGAMLEDLGLAQGQINQALAKRDVRLMNALDKRADREEERASASTSSSSSSESSSAHAPIPAPLADLDVADVFKAIDMAHDATNTAVVSAMSKAHDCIFRLAELVWAQIEGLLDPKTSGDLPAYLSLDGKVSSSYISKVVTEADGLLSEITARKTSYDTFEGDVGGSGCEDGLKQRATFAAETCAKMMEKLTRLQACQVYIVTQAADVHYIDDHILLQIFWDALCVSIPRVSREIYKLLEERKATDTLCVSMYDAFEKSWRKTGMCTAGIHSDLPSFDERCDQAIESSVNVLNTSLRNLAVSGVVRMQKLPLWKKVTKDAIKSRLKLWPKTRRPATEEQLGRGPRQLYLFVRGKLGIPMDSGDIPVFKYGEGLYTAGKTLASASPSGSSSGSISSSSKGKGKARAMDTTLEDIPEEEPPATDHVAAIQQSMSGPSGIIDLVMALLARRISPTHYSLSGLFPVVSDPLPDHPRMNPHHLARKIMKDTTPEPPVERKAGPRSAQSPFMHLQEEPPSTAESRDESLSNYDYDSDSDAAEKARQTLPERKPGSRPPRGSWRTRTHTSSSGNNLASPGINPMRSHPVHSSSRAPFSSSSSSSSHERSPSPSSSSSSSVSSSSSSRTSPPSALSSSGRAILAQRARTKKKLTRTRILAHHHHHQQQQATGAAAATTPAQVRLRSTSVDDFAAVPEDEQQAGGPGQDNNDAYSSSSSSSSSKDADDYDYYYYDGESSPSETDVEAALARPVEEQVPTYPLHVPQQQGYSSASAPLPHALCTLSPSQEREEEEEAVPQEEIDDDAFARDLAAAVALSLSLSLEESRQEEYSDDNDAMASSSGSGSGSSYQTAAAAAAETDEIQSDPGIERPFSALGFRDQDQDPELGDDDGDDGDDPRSPDRAAPQGGSE
ncbi:hypothetical protein F4809DRAFT_657916 [Biscogniauxia mediterranea]|nr:hypothetical protein F4809DRAFT_657916 [Biscogniauxia mediterranea]